MLESGKDVIAAAVPMKNINWDSVKLAVESKKSDFQNYGAYFNINSLEDNVVANIEEPLEVKYAGSGMMLIHRSVFEKLSGLVGSYHSDSVASGGIDQGEKILEYWKTSIHPESSRLLSEDYNFCEMFRSIGGKIYLDLKSEVKHLGSYLFSGKVYG
jgi:hypothetical protein